MSVNLPPSALNHVAYKPWKLKPAARWNVALRLCTSLTQSSRRFARRRGRQWNRCSGAQVWRLAVCDFFLKHFSLNILFCCFGTWALLQRHQKCRSYFSETKNFERSRESSGDIFSWTVSRQRVGGETMSSRTGGNRNPVKSANSADRLKQAWANYGHI